MTANVAPIAVVQGAATAVVQALLRDFAERLRQDAVVVGVVEDAESAASGDARAMRLRSLADGARYSLFQDLGPGAASCGLDAGGVAEACEAVRRDIVAGCDLVVLSKFGQLEVDRGGLAAAFAAAIQAQAPVLTAVSPKFDAPWARFAAPLYVVLPPTAEALDAWWSSARLDWPNRAVAPTSQGAPVSRASNPRLETEA